MPIYRKKPAQVEAIKVTKPWRLLREFAPEAVFVMEANGRSVAFVDVPTLEGTMRAEHGDYLIRGIAGDLYTCKPDIFEVTYYAV